MSDILIAAAPVGRLVQVGWFSRQHGEAMFKDILDSPEEPDDPAYRWKPAYVVREIE